jgi:pimeloyl-ACP methyl ester carboxylesterase
MPITEVDGFEIAYDDAGSGTVVLFTHGYQASRAMWAPQFAALKERYRPVTWDIRGHGESGIDDDPSRYSQELMVTDMRALLDHLSADRAVLVGHSLGGFASLRFYLDHPDRVSGLVLFGSGPGFRDPEARAKWNDMAERYARSIETKGLEILKKAGPEVAGAVHRSPTALAHAARGMLAQSDARVMEAVPQIAVPTLIIIGSEDERFMGSSQYMAKKVPGAELAVIEGGGHAVNMQQAGDFNAALLAFLDRLS